jgi:CheY-like chemotaxis protein
MIKMIQESSSSAKNIILFIDDESICHDFFNLIIKHYTKYQVLNAYSKNEAVKLLKQHHNEIYMVFLDIILQNGKGDEIYYEILESGLLKDAPVVFQSGAVYIEESIQNILLNNYNTGIIYKPYDKLQLIEYINDFIKDRQIV